jgi:hypothetical protein
MKKIVLLCAIMLVSCGVPQGEVDELKAELELAKTEKNKVLSELEECQNGASRLEAKVSVYYKEKNYSLAKESILLLQKLHPQSSKNKEFSLLYDKIIKEENKLIAKKKQVEKEKIRLANLSNTGIWNVSNYVDEFGEHTKKGYIHTDLKGLFSNSATQNSNLNISFLITGSSDIDFQLYEYARDNPVKSYGSDRYRVLIQDKDGKRHKLIATNHSDRLSFGTSHSKIVHNLLTKGGTIKFSLYEIDTPTNQYSFTIWNADYYDNAYRMLKSKK